MNTQTNYIPAAVVSGSMGCAFDAPGYPSYNYEVETDLTRKKENRGCMNIDYALTQDYISPSIKSKINKLIAAWNTSKAPLSAAVTKKWIKECVAYFGEHKADIHIRKFYPEY